MANQSDQDMLIEQTFIAGWLNGVTYFFPNAPIPDAMPSEYVRVASLPGSRQNISIGNLKTRCFGTVLCEVRVPKHTGTRRALEIAEDFIAIFENKYIGSIRTREANVNQTESQSHSGYNVLIPYEWDSQ